MSDNLIDNSNASPVNDDLQNCTTPSGANAGGAKVRGSTRGRKLKQLGLGLTVLFLIAIGGIWLMFGSNNPTKVRMQVGDRRAVSTGTTAARSLDGDAETAIAEARRLAQGTDAAARTPAIDTSSFNQKQNGVPSALGAKTTLGIETVKPNPQNSPLLARDLEAAVGSNPGEESTGPRREQSAKSRTGLSSQPNAEKSILFESSTYAAASRGAAGNAQAIPIKRVSDRVIARAPVIPSFGSILPVRALGAIYTLRSGGLVRLEVTRRVEGESWELDKGTVLVGTLRGSEFDRAFISLVGFIDPTTERLVKLGGNVLGTDGGDGLKGKRRKIGSGWSRALGQAGSSALGLAQSFASHGTTIVLPNLSGSYPSPLLDASRPRDFVEVAAGAQGYVMVTDLPREIKGVDVLESMSLGEIARASDSTLPSPETGLSEDTLAELLTSGSPEQIRAALPRMTPAMRRIAETVLSEGSQ